MAKETVAEHSLKQRLVGAIVLVSLAVIFIPMLLNGPGNFESLIVTSNIPDKPESGRKTEIIPLNDVPPRPERPAVSAVPVDEHTGKLPELTPAPQQEAESTTPKEESSAPTTRAAKESTKSTAEPPKAETSESKKAVTKEKEAKPVQTWAVQLGSFSSRVNAMALRDRVRAKGYPAYVEAISGAQGAIYRVRVGPEVDKAEAQKLQGKLREIFGLNGLVVRHKND